MDSVLILPSSCYVYHKANGEICNRLKKGYKVNLVDRKGEWLNITWRSGKKKGWICLADKT